MGCQRSFSSEAECEEGPRKTEGVGEKERGRKVELYGGREGDVEKVMIEEPERARTEDRDEEKQRTDKRRTPQRRQAAEKGGGVVARFAPSPTGPLHVGGARIALLNFLFSRQRRRAWSFYSELGQERQLNEEDGETESGEAGLGTGRDSLRGRKEANARTPGNDQARSCQGRTEEWAAGTKKRQERREEGGRHEATETENEASGKEEGREKGTEHAERLRRPDDASESGVRKNDGEGRHVEEPPLYHPGDDAASSSPMTMRTQPRESCATSSRKKERESPPLRSSQQSSGKDAGGGRDDSTHTAVPTLATGDGSVGVEPSRGFRSSLSAAFLLRIEDTDERRDEGEQAVLALLRDLR